MSYCTRCSEDERFRCLGIHLLSVVRQFNSLSLFDEQVILEDAFKSFDLSDKLIFYATSEVCNGPNGGFTLLSL